LRTYLALALLVASIGCASTSPESEDTYRQGLATAKSDTAGAIKILEEGVNKDPKHHRMRFLLARLQYDVGETQWIAEREARKLAAQLADANKPQDAQKAAAEGRDRHQKALPFIRASRENLQIVFENDSDEARQAWALYLAFRCDLFFDDYEDAAKHLQRSMDLGRPTGARQAQFQETLAQVKREADKRKKAGAFGLGPQ
jgi:hypothetical protein